nr:unnamed protein product [Callosobruchus analis]
MDNEVDQGEFKNLIKKRGVIKSKQTLFKKRFDAINSEISDKSLSGVPEEVILEVQNRLENLTKVFNEFDDIQNSIELLCDENTLDQQLTQREEVETLHYSLSAKGKKIVDVGDIENQSAVLSQASNNFRDHCDIKLPSISLPKFKGDYHGWLEFHDFFFLRQKADLLETIELKDQRSTKFDSRDSRQKDPDFDKPAEIDLLIGGGLYLNLLCVGRITLGGGLPILQKTRLGWVVGGEMVQEVLVRLFSECGDKNPVLSEDDVQCEKIFSSTTSRSVDGKFVVEIPFKVNPDEALGDTRAVAVKRFYSLESRLSKNPSLKARYTAFMKNM